MDKNYAIRNFDPILAQAIGALAKMKGITIRKYLENLLRQNEEITKMETKIIENLLFV